METTVLSKDSMLMVKDLETKVVSTEDGIELFVRVPIIWEGHETDGDIDAMLGAGAVPPGTYCQTPQCHLVKRPRLRGLPD